MMTLIRRDPRQIMSGEAGTRSVMAFLCMVFLVALCVPQANGQYFSYCESGSESELTLNVGSHDEHIRRINKKFEKYYYEWGRLPAELADEDIADVVGRLQEYLGGLSNRSAAVVFYAFDDTFERQCTWLINSSSVVSDVSSNINSKMFARKSSGLLGALGVTRMAQARASVRGVKPIDMDSGQDLQSMAVLLEINERLIPDKIAEVLHREETDTLIIVPVFGIGSFPFSLLRVEGELLVERMSVLIAPSFQSILEEPRQARRVFLDPIIVGDPCEEECYRDKKWIFKPLEGAQREAREVAQEINFDSPLIGRQATRARLEHELRNRPKVDLIYLATHGVADADDPNDESFLLLADGRWTARDISKVKLDNSPLVVMSACQTGLGKDFGVGSIGLARAWEYAGASSVVMSLWNVDDNATEALMTKFVSLSAKKPPDRALQEAMLQLRQEDKYSSPEYWAGFSVFGIPER